MEAIKEWFREVARDLPWRSKKSPYHVWISEIMLQQTRVSVVIPYYLNWMEQFPTIAALAAAPLDKVIKMWEGLGYYTRARNLHQAAQYIVEHFAGELPATAELLSQIKGIGPYTRGAILSFAFQKRAAAIDANVTRVISRLHGIENKQDIEFQVDNMLEDSEPWVVMEALIELGALVCGKKPLCSSCPLRSSCYAYRHQCIDSFPPKKKREPIIQLKRTVALISCKEHYLVRKVVSGVMQDLFEFPYTECEQSYESFEQSLGLKLRYLAPLKRQIHHFTRYRVELFPHLFETDELTKNHCWVKKECLQELAFSSGHRRIMLSL